MELTAEKRKELQEKVTTDINAILEKHDLPYRMDGISVMKTSKGTSFLGNIRVHDPYKVKDVRKEVEDYFESYGNVTFTSRDVVPCCELPYTYITFHIDYFNE